MMHALALEHWHIKFAFCLKHPITTVGLDHADLTCQSRGEQELLSKFEHAFHEQHGRLPCTGGHGCGCLEHTIA